MNILDVLYVVGIVALTGAVLYVLLHDDGRWWH